MNAKKFSSSILLKTEKGDNISTKFNPLFEQACSASGVESTMTTWEISLRRSFLKTEMIGSIMIWKQEWMILEPLEKRLIRKKDDRWQDDEPFWEGSKSPKIAPLSNPDPPSLQSFTFLLVDNNGGELGPHFLFFYFICLKFF